MIKNRILPYKTGDESLSFKKIQSEPEIKIESEQDDMNNVKSFDLYKVDADVFKFVFEIHNRKDPAYDVVINVSSRESLQRYNLTAKSYKEGVYSFQHVFSKDDWVGDVKIKAYKLLNGDRSSTEGGPTEKGQKYAESEEYLIRFTEPKEKSGKAPGLDPILINFKTTEDEKWLNKYENDIYAISYDRTELKNKYPRVFINENLLPETGKILSNATGPEKLLNKRKLINVEFGITLQVQILTAALAELRLRFAIYKYEKNINDNQIEEVIEENYEEVWDRVKEWEKEVLLSSYSILDIEKNNYKVKLLKEVSDDTKYLKLISLLPSLFQDQLDLKSLWENVLKKWCK